MLISDSLKWLNWNESQSMEACCWTKKGTASKDEANCLLPILYLPSSMAMACSANFPVPNDV